MKLTAFLLLVALLQVQAKGVSQKLSLTFKKAPLEKVFAAIEQQSSYSFVYKYNDIANKYVSELSIKNAGIKEALETCLKGQGLQYTITNNIIAIRKSEAATLSAIQATIEVKEPITGIVTNEKGELLAFVSVTVKGTKRGTTTNEKGEFSIQADKGNVLVFSSVGFEPKEMTIGNNTKLDITLKAAKEEMEKVVVTAMGIKRKEKALTYNVQEVSGSEVNTVKEASFVNSLAGKVAGVTINSSAAGIGGSTKVVMRGSKSIMGDNNALYVIDGIPMAKLSSPQADGILQQNRDYGDGISNINPDDIASVTVLTGASAAALYGGDAANGVVLITTKKGAAGKVNISVSNSTTFASPLILPRFQNNYGSDPESYTSWGNKLKTPSSYNPADFFQTSTSINNAFSISTGTDKNQTYLSGATLNSKGIIPNNTFDRYNISLRNTTSFLDNRLNLDLNLMYAKQKDQNMMGQGQYFNPLIPVYLFPRGDDIEKYKVYERYDVNRNFKTQFWPFGDLGLAAQNPYWIINRNFDNNDKDRYMMGANVKFDFTPWLNIVGRVKMDNTFNTFEEKLYASTLGLFIGGTPGSPSGGYYRNYGSSTRQTYTDVMLNLNKPLSTNFNLTAFLGGSTSNTKYRLEGYGGELGVTNMFSFMSVQKSAGKSMPAADYYHNQKQALFATAQLAYRNRIFLDVSDRHEWSSYLAYTKYEDKGFNYPAIGLSAIVSDLVPMQKNILSYAKVRTSYAEVGNPPALPFITRSQYPTIDGVPSGFTYMGADWLAPERTKSLELGTNLKFLKNKINLDFTYYNTNTYNQLFRAVLSASSGYNAMYINAGKISNKGIEASLGYNGNILKDLSWSSTVTYTSNRNKIEELVRDFKDPNSDAIINLDSVNIGGTDTYLMMLTKGGSLGDLYTTASLACDEHGYLKVDPQSGAISSVQNQIRKVGNSNPKFTVGFRNNFTYKNFNLGFLIDGRFGGECISATEAVLDQFGVSEATGKARDMGGVLKNGGLLTNITGYYNVVTGSNGGILSEYVYSATNVRLREAFLGYTIPAKLFNNKIKAINVSVIGRNLFMLYNHAPYDPELVASTGNNYQGFDYFMQPSLRSIGFSVKLQF